MRVTSLVAFGIAHALGTTGVQAGPIGGPVTQTAPATELVVEQSVTVISGQTIWYPGYYVESCCCFGRGTTIGPFGGVAYTTQPSIIRGSSVRVAPAKEGAE